jgi:hypothetical protein
MLDCDWSQTCALPIYLLSRVDGKRELETIVRVAPLREFEALTYFDRFRTQGWLQYVPVTSPS